MDIKIDEFIPLGLSVKISRSDGRIHGATVKAVHQEKGAVFVEWSENSATKAKEVEFGELWDLNRELFEYLKSSALNEKAPARTNKNESRNRTSKIPAPYELRRKSAVRRTCLLPLSIAQSYNTDEHMSFESKPSLPSASGIPCQKRRKNGLIRPSTFLPQVDEARMENEVPSSRIGSVVASTRRKSGASLEVEKIQNQHEANQTKNAEMQTKRNKDVDKNRPHWQFYKMIEEYKENLEVVPISLSDPVDLHRICVCVRKRPLNKQGTEKLKQVEFENFCGWATGSKTNAFNTEVARKEIDVVSVPGKGKLLVHEPKQKVDLTKYLENQVFHFDYSFDETATNELVYRLFSAKPLVQAIFEGGMATCFAYGQTGSGKTHTMGGDFSGKRQNSSKGIYALAAQDVFLLLNQKRYSSMGLDPYVSFFEIYNGKVFDLLNKKAKLRVLEDGKQQVQVVGLQEVNISCAEGVLKMIDVGSACRTSGQTFANANSSRSHAVLQVILRRGNKLHGKFSLVDLAGNERGIDVSSNDRQTMLEMAEINCSLLALKECIRSLGQNSEHVPFRMSKLTQVLRDSFIGENSKTCMIAMISPGMGSCEYTLNTLRYADRVKQLNGTSVAAVNSAKKMEVEDSDLSAEDSTPVDDVFDAECQVCKVGQPLCEYLQRSSEIIKMMDKPLYDPAAVKDYLKRLQEFILPLETALEQEKMASRKKSN
ncbi:kinesin-like protein KIF2C [Arapaima gigas]